MNKTGSLRLCDDPELRTLEGAERFYDERYRHGYMDSWPGDKLLKVSDVLMSLELPREGRVIDFGCGAGAFTAVLKACLPNWQVYGTDLSTEAVEVARPRLPGATFCPF